MDSHVVEGYWRRRRVLVTGASGLIGRWLVSRLASEGAIVVGTVRRPAVEPLRGDDAQRVRFLAGDICDRAFARRCLDASGADTVIHLAGRTTAQMGLADPAATFDSNLRGTWTLLDACRARASMPAVVLASSEWAARTPDDEVDAPLRLHPYQVSKTCGELLGQSFAATFGMSVALARLGNVYGGGDRNFSRLVPGTIQSLLRGERPVIRSSGRVCKRFLHADDASRGVMAIAECLETSRDLAPAFELSGDEEVSVNDVVSKIIDLMGSSVEPVVLATDAPQERHRDLPFENSERPTIGWAPRIGLTVGLAATIAWYRAHGAIGPTPVADSAVVVRLGGRLPRGRRVAGASR